MNKTKKGKIYPCATPIGNLDDMSPRAIKVLKNVNLIAAEDTRRTGKLLSHFDIETKMISYHEHNEKKRAEELIMKTTSGLDIALVSDAGMPGISDPGYELIKRAVKRGIEIIPIPGANAALLALVASGLPTDSFVFEGFIPRKGKERKTELKKIQNEERTMIIYESPYRIKTTLEDLSSILNDRKIALVREITKVHEEKIYGTANTILEKLKERNIKGEIVLVIKGREITNMEKEGWEDLSVVEHVKMLMENGYTKKEAIKKVSTLRELDRSSVYKEAVVIDAKDYL